MKPKGKISSIGLLALATPMLALLGGSQAISLITANKASSGNTKATSPSNALARTNGIEEWQQYIYDRTFSLQSISLDETTKGYSACWGTGWIISDATPDVADDYSYYIATNWHVYDGMESVKSNSTGTHKVQFGCKYDSNHLDPLKDYISFESFENMPEKDFSLDGKTTITINNGGQYKTGLEGIDFHISKGNFENVVNNNSPLAITAKAKLDRLNENTKNHKPITEFAPTTSDSLHFENKHMYTGGYPVHKANTLSHSPTWELHDINGEGFSLEYYNDQSEHTFAHDCDESSYPMIDASPQYRLKTPTTNNFMSGGASGSMLLGDFGNGLNHDFKVCGIYWGGWNSNAGFIPHYSIFNSDYKNFIESYIK